MILCIYSIYVVWIDLTKMAVEEPGVQVSQ